MMSEPEYGDWSEALMNAPIRYAQSWEDPATVVAGLEANAATDVLAIASGGDNCFALLLAGARSVMAVDMNPAQIALIELKARAIEQLPCAEGLHFIGAHAGDEHSGRHRARTYAQLRTSLSDFARAYWDRRPADIAAGVIHQGKFERYFALFRRRFLPLMQTPETVRLLLGAADCDEQRRLYDALWNNRRWRAFFRVFFSKLLLGRLGRERAFFAQVRLEGVGAELLHRTERGLTAVSTADNYFVEYILTGGWRDPAQAHPWMRPEAYALLRERLPRLVCRVGRMEECRPRNSDSFDAFYCSDIFEYMSPAAADTAMQSLRAIASPAARLLYYTLFVPRAFPAFLSEEKAAAEDLFSRDRTFFYGSVHMGRFTA